MIRGRASGPPRGMRASAASLVAFVAFAAVACGSPGAGGTTGVTGDGGPPIDAGGSCEAVVQQHPIEGFTHVPVCSAVSYLTKPPSSGNHYPIWAAYESYASAIPQGFWVHNLEHGAVVFSYNCPGGCPSEIAAAQALIDALPSDPQCNVAAGNPRVRMVMTPDPTLDVRFAASAWGWTLRASCFDAKVFGDFVSAHYGQGREAVCGQGQDLSTGVPATCGH